MPRPWNTLQPFGSSFCFWMQESFGEWFPIPYQWRRLSSKEWGPLGAWHRHAFAALLLWVNCQSRNTLLIWCIGYKKIRVIRLKSCFKIIFLCPFKHSFVLAKHFLRSGRFFSTKSSNGNWSEKIFRSRVHTSDFKHAANSFFNKQFFFYQSCKQQKL